MIVIYGKPECGWCERSKKLASQYNLAYEYVDIQYEHNLNELKEKIGDVKTVPQIFWHGRHVGGYDGFANEISNTMGGYGDGLF